MRAREKTALHSGAVVAVLVVAIMAASVPAGADTRYEHPEYYEADPLGLISFYDSTSYYANQADTIEAWICELTEDGQANLTTEQLADNLNRSGIPDFYKSLSGGRYEVKFVPGGTIRTFAMFGCRRNIDFVDNGNTAALFAVPNGKGARVSGPLPVSTARTTYPSNGREMAGEFRNGLQDMNVAGITQLMGVLLGWPNSYTGILPENATLYPSDNPMDLSSIGNRGTLHVGPIAINRYASGWIDPDDVRIYEGGTESATLSVDWEAGTQMIVLPTGEQGNFLSLGARVAKLHDRGIPKEGVEAYLVLQDDCSFINLRPCWGIQRRTIPYPHDTQIAVGKSGALTPKNPVKHVFGVGQHMTWNNITVTVLERIGDQWVVDIREGTDPAPRIESTYEGTDRFTDDNSNTHEANINRIAEAGITVGCATVPAKFCPDRPVTRAEMATFMLRAVGESQPTPSRFHTFEDVPDDVWYTNYVHALAERGVDRGHNGQWRPTDPLTRLEMAHWITRMLESIPPAEAVRGLFEDVPFDNESNLAAIEGIFRSGVTYGCLADPLRYCPDSPVTRGQMASFIIRALNRG